MNEVTTLLYLGLRGGGSRLLVDVSRELSSDNNIQVICSRDNEDIEELSSHISTLKIQVPHNSKQVVRAFRFYFDVFRWMRFFTTSKTVVFMMPHYLDYIFLVLAKLFKINVLYLVHDAENHPGEKWPTKKAIKRRVRNVSEIGVFSQYVKAKVDDLTSNPIKVFELRHYPPKAMTKPKELLVHDYCLTIGRIRDYKGIHQLVEAWRSISLYETLIIAGQGDFKGQQLPNVQVINRWLTNSEFTYLIANAKLVILPYTEASQSGVLASSGYFGKPTLVSNVGGLVDQNPQSYILNEDLELSTNIKVVLQSISNQDLGDGLTKGFKKSWDLIDYLKSR